MRDTDCFSEHQRRLLVHVYASLRQCISDELDYDRSPNFEPLDPEAREELGQVIYTELTALMYAAHADEAATIEAQRAEAAERMEEEWLAATWRLDVGDEIADWLDDLDKDGQR
jgi:hypothetical protein